MVSSSVLAATETDSRTWLDYHTCQRILCAVESSKEADTIVTVYHHCPVSPMLRRLTSSAIIMRYGMFNIKMGRSLFADYG